MAIVVLILFGRGKIAETMGDFGKGIRSFRQGVTEEDTKKPLPPAAPSASETQAKSATPE